MQGKSSRKVGDTNALRLEGLQRLANCLQLSSNDHSITLESIIDTFKPVIRLQVKAVREKLEKQNSIDGFSKVVHEALLECQQAKDGISYNAKKTNERIALIRGYATQISNAQTVLTEDALQQALRKLQLLRYKITGTKEDIAKALLNIASQIETSEATKSNKKKQDIATRVDAIIAYMKELHARYEKGERKFHQTQEQEAINAMGLSGVVHSTSRIDTVLQNLVNYVKSLCKDEQMIIQRLPPEITQLKDQVLQERLQDVQSIITIIQECVKHKRLLTIEEVNRVLTLAASTQTTNYVKHRTTVKGLHTALNNLQNVESKIQSELGEQYKKQKKDETDEVQEKKVHFVTQAPLCGHWATYTFVVESTEEGKIIRLDGTPIAT